MELMVAKDYQEMSLLAAEVIAKQVKKKPDSVLGLATGSTPLGMYGKLLDMVNNENVSFKNVTTFNLDEYVGLALQHAQSYHTYMMEHFFSKIDIDLSNTHIPYCESKFINEIEVCNKACAEYDDLIEHLGGIDLQILGIGSNGHIGFNEPATSLETGTHIVSLTEETRIANARFFSSFDEVPTHAITMGVGTILKSKEILLLANGSNKAEVIANMFSGRVDTFLPASLLQVHPNVTVIIDKEAASKLENKYQTNGHI